MAKKEKVDVAENLFQATNILIEKSIEKISFDTTIEATIIDDSKAADGIYTVSTGNANFLAYSSTETGYKEKDVVMVTVPQGDYSKQKIIIGKKVNKENESAVPYKSPFSQIIDVTNNLITENKEFGITANKHDNYSWDEDIKNFEDSQACGQTARLYEVSNLAEFDYTYLGLRAQFATALSDFNVISGNYGLGGIIKFVNKDDGTTVDYPIVFDCSEFFGNPYEFEVYFNQEVIFNILGFDNYYINKISLYAYQRNNFKNIDGELIEYSDEEHIYPNIFIRNVYICLGSSAENFEKDSVKIINKSGNNKYSSINNNAKNLELRWIHQNPETATIGLVVEDQIPEDYQIRWYRQRYPSEDVTEDSPSDKYLSSQWILIEENKISIDFQPSVLVNTERVRVIIIKNNEKVADSQVEEFYNEHKVPDQPTLPTDALAIKFDDEDTLQGNYFVYDKTLNIIDDYKNVNRSLSARFSLDKENVSIENKSPVELTENATLTWLFPKENTMIQLDSNIINNSQLENGFYKYIQVYNSQDTSHVPLPIKYTIKDKLSDKDNSYNTVYVIYKTEDGKYYNASVEMLFGERGIMGTDYSLNVTWDDNAFDIHSENGLTGEVTLYGPTRQPVELENGQYYEYSWYKIVVNEHQKDVEEDKKEDRDFYYPVHVSSNEGKFQPMKIKVNNSFENFDTALNNKYPKYWLSFDLHEGDFELSGASYNINTSKFTSLNEPITKESHKNEIVYSKLKKENGGIANKRYKIEFKPFYQVIVPNENESSGYIEETENGNIYYYDLNKKAFILDNGNYIIDPYNEYYSDLDYYYPVYTHEKEYSNESNYALNIAENSDDNKKFIITKGSNYNISMNDLYILEVRLINFEKFDLVARFPLALKNSDIYTTEYSSTGSEYPLFIVNNIEGPAEVRYSSTGEIDFDREPYCISFEVLSNALHDEKEYISCWQNYEDQYDSNYTNRVQGLFGYWKIIYENNDKLISLPVLSEANSSITPEEDKFKKPKLLVPSVYIKDKSICGVQFVLSPKFYPGTNKYGWNGQYMAKNGSLQDGYAVVWETNNPAEEIILWTQPIYIYQDNYPSTTLSKWNGEEIVMKEEEAVILAKGFSAGKKEDDNTFTGVMIGDWSDRRLDTTPGYTDCTGIYGLHKNKQCFAFKDDGTASIGEDGCGRIYFDGNNGIIESGNYKAWGTDGKTGTRIDLKNSKIDMWGNKTDGDNNLKTHISFDTSPKFNEPYFQITDIDSNKSLIYIGNNDYFLQSKDYTDEEINRKKNGLKLDLNTGYLSIYSKKNLNREEYQIKLGNNNSFLQIQRENFNYSHNFFENWNNAKLVLNNFIEDYYNILDDLDRELSLQEQIIQNTFDLIINNKYNFGPSSESSDNKIKTFICQSVDDWKDQNNYDNYSSWAWQNKIYNESNNEEIYNLVNKYISDFKNAFCKKNNNEYILENGKYVLNLEDYFLDNLSNNVIATYQDTESKKYKNFVNSLEQTFSASYKIKIENNEIVLDYSSKKFKEGLKAALYLLYVYSYHVFRIAWLSQINNIIESEGTYFLHSLLNNINNIIYLFNNNTTIGPNTAYQYKDSTEKIITLFKNNSWEYSDDENFFIASIAEEGMDWFLGDDTGIDVTILTKLLFDPAKKYYESYYNENNFITIFLTYLNNIEKELKKIYNINTLDNNITLQSFIEQENNSNIEIQDLFLIKTFSFDSDSFILNVNDNNLLNNNQLFYDKEDNIIVIQYEEWTQDMIPFLKEYFKKNEEQDFQNIYYWENDLINLNKNGGYLTSKNYRPTIYTNEFTEEVYIDNNGQEQIKQHFKIINPVENQDKSVESWRKGMRGLVIDLTNDKIKLGNNARIEGYQTEFYPGHTGVNHRMFAIGTGVNFNSSFNLSSSKQKDAAADFLYIKSGPYSSLGNLPVKFRIRWDGTVHCKDIKGISDGTSTLRWIPITSMIVEESLKTAYKNSNYYVLTTIR